MYKGSYVAIVTPFKDNNLDEEGLRRNIRFLLNKGSSGIVACATTGESPSLSNEEFEKVVANIASKKPIALRIGKEIMAKSVDGCDMETALAVERNGIQWLTYSPDIQAVMDQFRAAPDQLTQNQKQKNIESDKK